MLSRQAILILSFFTAMVAYALFFTMAPRIILMQGNLPEKIIERFVVRLDEPPVIPEETKQPEQADVAASKPGSIRDLLTRESGDVYEARQETEFAEMDYIEKNIGADAVNRQYELQQDRRMLAKADAKIMEISQQNARLDIDVPRRIVRPSPDRVLKENEFPVLRVPTDPNEDPVLRLPGPVFSGAGQVGSGGIAAQKPAEKPVYEEKVLEVARVEPEAAKTPIEELVGQAPIQQEVKVAREESSYAFMDELVDIEVSTYVPPGASEGYFRLYIEPKRDSKIDPLPKDITYVIDASSSINQRKLTLTARGLIQAIQKLRTDDYFNIVVFRDSGTPFRPERVPATPENKAAAEEFLSNLEAKGETDVYQAILPVVQSEPREGIPGVVMVITDGRPTRGVKSGREIINGLTADNADKNTIFAFGGGRTVNQYLLDLLAYRNKGEAYVAPRIEDIEEGVSQFTGKLKDPLLVNIQADYGRINDATVFPASVPDFYQGKAVVLYGRFEPGKDKRFVARLSGKAGEKSKEIIFRADLEQARQGDDSIAKQWAFEKAYNIIGEISRVGETPELLAQLRELRDKYGVRTSYDD